MTFKRTVLILTLGAAALGAVSTAASADPLRHPRRAEVTARDLHQREQIRAEMRRGEIGPAKAHRLLAADRRIERREQAFARHHHGHLTKVEQRRLNRHENRVERHIKS